MHTTSLHLCMKKIKSITQSRKDAEEQPKIDLNLFISILPLCAFASLREKKILHAELRSAQSNSQK